MKAHVDRQRYSGDLLKMSYQQARITSLVNLQAPA